MSAVVDAISDAIDAAVDAATATWSLIAISTVLAWELGGEEVLEYAMSLLGITDEDIISTNVSDQRLLADDDDLAVLMTQVALEHQQTQYDIIDLLSIKSSQVRGNINNYYTYGRDTFIDGLLNSNISARAVDDSLIKQAIDEQYTVSSTLVVDSTALRVPTEPEYVLYTLQNSYSYQPWTNTLVYTDTYEYTVKTIDYNFTTDLYDVTMYRAATKVTEVTVTITPYVEAYPAYSGTTQYVVGDHVEEAGVSYKCIADSLGNTPPNATYWVVVDYDNKNTLTRVTYTTVEGDIIEDTSVDELIPAGSEVDSYVTDSPGVSAEYGTIIIQVASFIPVQYYIAKWYTTDPAEWYYWIYEAGSGGYLYLDNANTYISELEMLPVVELRNATVSVTSDPLSTRYLQSKEILNYIGLDIDVMVNSINENPNISNIEDAFVHFGVDPNVSDPITAKFLYQMFDFLYFDTSLITSTAKYTATFKEGPYNIAVSWVSQSRTVVTGVIGPLDTFTNHVSGLNLVLRKQENTNQYVEYVISALATATFIDRGGLMGMVPKDLGTGGITIPVSRFFVDGLSSIEQMQLFRKALRLSVYAADVIHLDWYETADFYDLIGDLTNIIETVMIVTTLGSGNIFSLVALYGTSYAFEKILEEIDNPYLKAAFIIAVAVALQRYELMATQSAFFFVANQLTAIVSQENMKKMEELEEARKLLQSEAEKRQELIDKAYENMQGYISTAFITDLNLSSVPPATMDLVDTMMYNSRDIQYEWGLLKGDVYENVYDYNKYFTVGVTSFS